MNKQIVSLILLVLCINLAHAHQLGLFATLEGQQITGYAYFPGGGRAQGISVELYGDASDKPLLTTLTDTKGQFIFQPEPQTSYRLIAYSVDGHQARFQLASTLPATAAVKQPSVEPDSSLTLADIDQLLARHLASLHEKIQQQQDRRAWQDLLGALGYIIGLAGLSLYWFSRKS